MIARLLRLAGRGIERLADIVLGDIDDIDFGAPTPDADPDETGEAW